jgi:hypothetical protein
MSEPVVLSLLGFAVFNLGFVAGWFARSRMPSPPPVADIQKYMASAVNREKAEEQRRTNRLVLSRADRRTMRVDGGPPATVHRMRHRKATRPPID